MTIATDNGYNRHIKFFHAQYLCTRIIIYDVTIRHLRVSSKRSLTTALRGQWLLTEIYKCGFSSLPLPYSSKSPAHCFSSCFTETVGRGGLLFGMSQASLAPGNASAISSVLSVRSIAPAPPVVVRYSPGRHSPGNDLRWNITAPEILQHADIIMSKSKAVHDTIAQLSPNNINYDTVIKVSYQLVAVHFISRLLVSHKGTPTLAYVSLK